MARPKKNAMESAIAQQDDTAIPQEFSTEDIQAPLVDVKDIVVPAKEEEMQPEVEEPLYNADELRAIETGWTPQEVFQGDPKNWRDAKTWNEGNKTLSTLEVQRREIEELKKTQNEMLQLLKEERQRATQAQLLSLEKQKEEAIKASDVEGVKKIDAVIKSLGTGMPVVKQEEEQPKLPQAVIDFVNRNPWWNKQDEISQRKTMYARNLEIAINSRQTGMSDTEKYNYIEEMVSKQFGPERPNISPVENKRTSMNPTKKIDNVPDYDSLDLFAKKQIEYFAQKEAFKARKAGKPFDIVKFRQKYIKELVRDRVVDGNGGYRSRNDWVRR